GKGFAFYPEALVFRQMPVKYVELYCGHAVQVPLKDVERDKVAADVNHQSAPGKTRTIIDNDRRRSEAFARGRHQLKKGLQPAHHAERGRCAQLGARISD